MTHFKGIQRLPLVDPVRSDNYTHTHTHARCFPLTHTLTLLHLPPSISHPHPPNPLCFPLTFHQAWGWVYRNLPVLSHPLSFLPSIPSCATACACLSGCLSPASPLWPTLSAPATSRYLFTLHLSSPPLPKNTENAASFHRQWCQTGWQCLTYELKMSPHTERCQKTLRCHRQSWGDAGVLGWSHCIVYCLPRIMWSPWHQFDKLVTELIICMLSHAQQAFVSWRYWQISCSIYRCELLTSVANDVSPL